MGATVFRRTEYDDWVFVLMHYNAKWRQHRRVVVQSFQPDALASAQPVVTASVHDLLEALLHTPDKFSEHIGLSVSLLGFLFSREVSCS